VRDGSKESLHEVATRFVEREMLGARDGGTDQPPVHVTREQWARMVEMGWPGLLIPPSAGGHGRRLGHLAAVISAFARHGLGTPLATVAAEVPALLLAAATAQQQERWLRAIAEEGRLVTTALWELPRPIQFGSVMTTWKEAGEGYELNGSKLPVAHAGLADAFVVLARQESTGQLGLFLVEREAPGVEVATLRTTTDDATGELVLSATRITEAGRLGAGDPAKAVEHALDVGAVLSSADLTISAQRGLELTLDYVRQRSQFGQPIGSFQAVHHHCADMYRDVEAMRVICARLLDTTLDDRLPPRDVSILKAKTSSTARSVLERAHQLHGGVGFYTDYPLERLYRRSLVEQGAYGSSGWHRSRLAALLKERPEELQRNVRAL
jgi:alkylation response protein AidB-like acyl-CoA dehydrogenase